MFSTQTQASDYTLTPKEMDAIITSILQGKYSIACLLLLEATNQDPLHFIPYRTYNRLQKKRLQALRSTNTQSMKTPKAAIADLEYIETIPETAAIKGGFVSYRLFPFIESVDDSDR